MGSLCSGLCIGRASPYIDAKEKRILFHCHAGASRSPAITIAVLMVRMGWTLETALAHVRHCRLVANPHAFLPQLATLEELLNDPTSYWSQQFGAMFAGQRTRFASRGPLGTGEFTAMCGYGRAEKGNGRSPVGPP